MDLFNDSNLEKSKLHSKYNIIKSLPFHKEYISEMFNGFHDRDNKIIKEFQTTFHSSFWEIYLFAVFKQLNLNLINDYNRPDFIIENNNKNILIEATVSNIKKDGASEETRNLSNYMDYFTPPFAQDNFEYDLNESIARYSNSIMQKTKLYKSNYANCPWVNIENPYVIGLSSYSQVDYGREYLYGILALLYGVYFDNKTMSYKNKESITKNNSFSEIPLGIFSDEAYKDVSAILFSSSTTVGKISTMLLSTNDSYKEKVVFTLYNDLTDSEIPYKLSMPNIEHPEALQDGLFVLHNPNANNPLSLDLFDDPAITQVFINEKKQLEFIGNLCPTILRLDVPVHLADAFASIIFPSVHEYNSFINNELSQ